MIDTKHLIDVRGWGEFKVGDYFTQERGKEKAPKQNKDGDCSLIQETNSNNGFDRLVQPTVIFKGNAITISINYASNVFYQKDDFCASVNIAIIRNDNLNLYNGYFIASVLSSAHRKFDYQNKISKELIDDEIIKLPATPDGQPDWDYMESYMKAVMEESEKSLENLKKADDTKHLIDVSGWKEFRVGDLFDTSLSKDDIQPKSIVEGDIPLISSSKTDNGIVAYIQDDKATLQKAGTITADMFGKVFYQSNPYHCVSHGRVNILTPKFDINEYIGLFIASVIERISNEKYTFDSICTGKKLAEDIISLPIKSDGQPDWDYMESYMKAVMEESEQIISSLQIGA